MSGSKYFVDTNVLAYALDEADPEKQRRAQHMIVSHGGDLVVSTQVLIELYAVCTRKLGIAPVDAASAVRTTAQFDVVPADRTLILDAIGFAQSQPMSVFDAAIVCAAQRAGCRTLLTEDLNNGQAFGELVVVNPFGNAATG